MSTDHPLEAASVVSGCWLSNRRGYYLTNGPQKGVPAAAGGGGDDDLAGRLLFAQLCGSRAFNAHVETSDRDYYAVIAAPMRAVLAAPFGGFPRTWGLDAHKPVDCIIVEAAAYAAQLLQGANPKLIEPLFVPVWQGDFKNHDDDNVEEAQTLAHEQHAWCDGGDSERSLWRELLESRNVVAVNEHVMRQYLGYAYGKLKGVDRSREKGPSDAPLSSDDAKAYYHILRLLLEAKRIAEGVGPQVWFPTGSPEQQELVNCRRGVYSAQTLAERAASIQAQVDAVPLHLPAVGDGEVMNEWVLRCRAVVSPVEALPEPVASVPGCIGDSSSIVEKCYELLNAQGAPPGTTLICVIPSGSHAFGTQTKTTSDSVDYIGVYCLPARCYLGTDFVLQKVKAKDSVVFNPDGSEDKGFTSGGIRLHEAGSACTLIQNGNHRLWEALLYGRGPRSKAPVYRTEIWMELVEQWRRLLTLTFVHHIVGVCRGQIKKAEGIKDAEPRDAAMVSAAFHAYRLLKNANRALDGKKPHGRPTDDVAARMVEFRNSDTLQASFVDETRDLLNLVDEKGKMYQGKKGTAPAAEWPFASATEASDALGAWLVRLRRSVGLNAFLAEYSR